MAYPKEGAAVFDGCCSDTRAVTAAVAGRYCRAGFIHPAPGPRAPCGWYGINIVSRAIHEMVAVRAYSAKWSGKYENLQSLVTPIRVTVIKPKGAVNACGLDVGVPMAATGTMLVRTSAMRHRRSPIWNILVHLALSIALR